ncbi:exodeoxyribonuclease VII large subunit [Paracoccus aerodenitrificans]|uniref:exodeoxyribonuclease VII large subunit n=1 Tax=Paracoccus aerodenitrificans TaxID=3017781 RepID=UPI0022EFEC1C|nr:exodeoxyribonuclease VII large subunit [Paracoccus aerodenitrificans]WBU65197.1 exodeoxyribonuclease VII large subunit [Paracoccus aerodenitrificans]
MSDLFEDPSPGSNAPPLSVSEISGAVKRVIEGEFGRVRVRGEIGRVSMPRSGHVYFDLKDDRAVIASVSWKGQVARLSQKPEEGMEVIATGKLTTFAGQSKYQLIVDDLEPAGAGALMAMLEKRRKALAAEGLFDAERKKPLPFLPRVIGVVTSPSGAVIRDILHRLRDRFPSHVVIWPVAVQGAASAAEVANAIRGFNALPDQGPIPRPDLLIVARGGGSIEDLWGFNEEIVVRAAAESRIPLISAVGHETDTTLIDFASDRRAPTPTAAAEMAVPVRRELGLQLQQARLRMGQAMGQRQERMAQRLVDLGRALGRPQALTEGARQRLDFRGGALEPALRNLVLRRKDRLSGLRLTPAMLARQTDRAKTSLETVTRQIGLASRTGSARRKDRLDVLAQRLTNGRSRVISDARRKTAEGRERLAPLEGRLQAAFARSIHQRQEAMQRLDRMRVSLGYTQTLERGFAVIRDATGQIVTTAQAAGEQARLEIEFADGTLPVRNDRDPQGSLF